MRTSLTVELLKEIVQFRKPPVSGMLVRGSAPVTHVRWLVCVEAAFIPSCVCPHRVCFAILLSGLDAKVTCGTLTFQPLGVGTNKWGTDPAKLLCCA